MNELALFAGAGGGILGGHLLGWRTVAAVEVEDYPRRVLLQRQADGILPRFPIWDDVCTFDGKPWRGKVDVISGGFPCQDISCAGKGEGITGARSGLWGEMARIICEVRPRFVFVENSPMLTLRGLGVVLGDLAEMGYDARWGVLGARDAGAPHKRDRIWIMADSRPLQRSQERGMCAVAEKLGQEQVQADSFASCSENVANTISERGCSGNARRENAVDADTCCEVGMLNAGGIPGWWDQDPADVADSQSARPEESLKQHGVSQEAVREDDGLDLRCNGVTREASPTQPAVGRVANGVAHRVDRLKAIGNGQVPQVAAMAWRILSGLNEQEHTT